MRREISFPSEDAACRGWLYLPDEPAAGPLPGIVTANAITAIKEITLPTYAERFAAAGFAVLAFDYRFWGESDGEPRNQWVSYAQQQDLRNGITWLGAQPEVDAGRIGGWGLSMGGSHMLYLAAFERRLKAVVATAAAVNGVTMFEQMIGAEGIKGMLAGLALDRAQRFEQGSPATHKQAWGRFGEDVLLPQDEAFGFYEQARATVAPSFDNRITVQSIESLVEYNPDYALHLASPTAVLFVHAERDVVPVPLIQEAYERTSEPKRLVLIDCLHSDLYWKEPFVTQSSEAATAWFREHVQHG